MFITTLSILWSLTLLLLYFLFSIIQQSYALKSSKKPSLFSSYGPPSHPIIGCLISFYKNQHRLLDWYTDMLSTSPSQTIVIQRLGVGRRIIVTANPANVEYILKTNFSNFPKGKPLTELLGDLFGCGIFNVDGELWSTQRKLASHEFSTRSLREFVVKTLEEEVEQRLVPLLEEAAESRRVLDMQDVLKRFSFDTVCKVSLGTDPFCLDLSRPVPPLVKAFDCASEISARRATAPLYVIWKLKRALVVGSESKLKDAIKVVHDSVQEIVDNKRKILEENEGKSCGSDLLSRLLLAGHDEKVVRDMVISFILAGRDTTPSAMTWLFWLLSKHPSVQHKIVNEVAEVLKNNTSSSIESGTAALGFEELQEMKYLKACLCESMRLYPPVPWDSKHAEAGTVLPDGTWVGKGDRVTYFPYGMGRMEELWGKDRFEFKPDRWFSDDSGRVMKMVSPYKFPVFQAGPRVCLGKEMAFIQMKYVIASVLRRFEIKPVHEMDKPVFVPLLTAHMAGGLKVLVQKRS